MTENPPKSRKIVKRGIVSILILLIATHLVGPTLKAWSFEKHLRIPDVASCQKSCPDLQIRSFPRSSSIRDTKGSGSASSDKEAKDLLVKIEAPGESNWLYCDPRDPQMLKHIPPSLKEVLYGRRQVSVRMKSLNPNDPEVVSKAFTLSLWSWLFFI